MCNDGEHPGRCTHARRALVFIMSVSQGRLKRRLCTPVTLHPLRAGFGWAFKACFSWLIEASHRVRRAAHGLVALASSGPPKVAP